MTLKNKLFEFDKKAIEHCLNSVEIASVENLNQDTKQKSRNDVILIGTDEAGRGPGAGGVFASAVCFQSIDNDLIEQLSLLNDSKKLSKKHREYLFEIISKKTIHSTVCIEVAEIEKINILNASLKAMKLACENVIKELEIQGNNALVLVDGNKLIKQFEYPQKFVIKGDSKSASIAAASILAKVSRDFYMQELDKKFPQYNWRKNAGYLTQEHLHAIDIYGVSPIHRKTFLKKHFERKSAIAISEKNRSPRV